MPFVTINIIKMIRNPLDIPIFIAISIWMISQANHILIYQYQSGLITGDVNVHIYMYLYHQIMFLNNSLSNTPNTHFL